MSRKNSLKSRIKNFGDNFVDSVTLPELEFLKGTVERVFNNRADVQAYQGKLKSKIPSNPTGTILIKKIKGALPLAGSRVIAVPMLRGISYSVANFDLVIFCCENVSSISSNIFIKEGTSDEVIPDALRIADII